MAIDVFVSYSQKDIKTVEAIVNKLEFNNIKCWYAKRDCVPGIPWTKQIIKAIKSSKIFILVFSDSSNNSTEVEREIRNAADNGLTIIPFRIDDSHPNETMEYYLPSIHWLDALTEPREREIEQLVDSVKVNLEIIAGNRLSGEVPFSKQGNQRPGNIPASIQDNGKIHSQTTEEINDEAYEKRNGSYRKKLITGILAVVIAGVVFYQVNGWPFSIANENPSETAYYTTQYQLNPKVKKASLREGPSPVSQAVETISDQESLIYLNKSTVDDEGYTWLWLLTEQGMIGWVPKEIIEKSEEGLFEIKGEFQMVNLRNNPSLEAEVLQIVQSHSKLIFLGEIHDEGDINWLKVKTEEGSIGWIAGNLLNKQ